MYPHTICSTLGDWTLAASTADSDTVYDISLLGLVTQTASLVRSGWARSTVDDVQLSKLYYALSANVQRVYSKAHQKMATINLHVHNIPICPESRFEVLIRLRGCERIEVAKGSIYLTSQHRTRRRKRRTSDCFFFCNSSTYLRAPICEMKELALALRDVASRNWN